MLASRSYGLTGVSALSASASTHPSFVPHGFAHRGDKAPVMAGEGVVPCEVEASA